MPVLRILGYVFLTRRFHRAKGVRCGAQAGRLPFLDAGFGNGHSYPSPMPSGRVGGCSSRSSTSRFPRLPRKADPNRLKPICTMRLPLAVKSTGAFDV